jgi:hypothetical protein
LLLSGLWLARSHFLKTVPASLLAAGMLMLHSLTFPGL